MSYEDEANLDTVLDRAIRIQLDEIGTAFGINRPIKKGLTHEGDIAYRERLRQYIMPKFISPIVVPTSSLKESEPYKGPESRWKDLIEEL